VRAAGYSATGDRIAIGFDDGTVLMTDDALAAPRELLSVPDASVASVAFSGDGERVAAALDDRTVRVLAADGSGDDETLRGHEASVLGVDINAAGSQVVSADDDGIVRLWNLADGGPGTVLYHASDSERDVEFSPDGSRIMAVGDEGTIRFWNARTGGDDGEVPGGGRDLNTAAFSADGLRFAAGGRDGVTRVWTTAGGPPVAELRGQRSRVLDVGFGRTSDSVVSAAEDGTVRMWNAAGRTQSWAMPSLNYGIDFNADGQSIVSGSEDGTARVWDPATGELQTSLEGPGGQTLATFSPTDDTVLIASSSRARLWPVAAKSTSVAVELPAGRLMASADFDGTGDRLVYVDDAGNVVVRELASGREVALEGARGPVFGAVFSPDGKYVAAATLREAFVWRVDRPAQPVSTLKGHSGPVNWLDISRDNRIVSAGSDGTIRLWDTAGRQHAVMRGNEDEVTTAIFTTDGAQVLSSGQDGSLRLFDARTGGALAVLQYEGQLYDVAQSRNGAVATLGTDDIVRVLPCDFCGKLDRVRALALSRSPRQLTADEREHFLAAAE
jgi:WD40 repeat protein